MLFGHQNDDTNQPAQITPTTQDTGVNPLAVDPATGASLPVAPTSLPDPDEPSVLNQPPALDDTAATAPVVDLPTPPAPDPTPVDTTPEPSDASPFETPAHVAAPMVDSAPASVATDSPADGAANDTLIALKQQALAQLSPLVGQLDQTPEERFRTTMMMIQSTDNQALIQDAYDAAQAITDEKVRAQALLDVINEINYFTQQK